ncbi:MAG TPA: vWA domain-containing protein, partial [Polyangiaceae bacterium]
MTSFARLRFAGASGFLFAVAACSAGGDRPGSGGLDPSGGSSGSGGSLPLAGNAGTAPKGGSGGGSAGTLAIAGNTSSGGSGGEAKVCDAITATSHPLVPTVTLLVDNSSSMFETEPPAWPLLYGALMDPTAGVLQGLQNRVRFGFAAFKGSTVESTEASPMCASWTEVPPAIDNRAAIDAAYEPIESTWSPGTKWETPTAHAINKAAADLVAFTADPPGPKYILLVTDGNPNTCAKLDPQCGQDQAIKAVQDAAAQGIGLFILGLGDIVAQPNNGCPTSARCGLLHLQDMANAGVAAPVQPPPTCDDPASPDCQYKYAGCHEPDKLLTATYTPAAPDVGIPFAVDTRNANAQVELATTLTGLLSDVVSCTFDMNAIVTGDPTNSAVVLEGTPLTYGDTAGGWILEPNGYQVTLQGTACEQFKSASMGGSDVNVSITFYCDAE